MIDGAIERVVSTYKMMSSQAVELSEEARTKVMRYMSTLVEAGEKDANRLAVCGLIYLRELDGSNDPVKEGYTGL